MDRSPTACGEGWSPLLTVLYISSDLLMLGGYSVMGYLFFSYLKPRHVTVLRRIFVALGWVMILCGLTHGVRVLGFMINWPWLIVGVNLISSVGALTLLLLIVPMLPAIMKFPSVSKMSKVNSELREEISSLLETNAKLSTVDNIKAVSNITCAIKAIRDLSVSQQ